MNKLFQKIPFAFPTPIDYINKQEILLIDIGDIWFMDKQR